MTAKEEVKLKDLIEEFEEEERSAENLSIISSYHEGRYETYGVVIAKLKKLFEEE